MTEKLYKFDEAHPEYKDLWYDIFNTYQTVYYKNLTQAFADLKAGQEEDKKAAPAEDILNAEDREKLEKIMDDMTNLINKSFESNVSKVFDVFNTLAKDGEFFLNESSASNKTETEASTDLETQMKAVLEEYETFKKEHPDLEEKESEAAKKANEKIYSELKKAQENSKEEVTKEIEALFDKYNVPEKDREEITGMLTTMVQQINANFEESVKNNDALGPIIFGGM